MKHRLATIFALILLAPTAIFAAGFERPVPKPQTETAEVWFLIASVALIAALAAVHMLVQRR
ncbi:hypothetical protein G5B38_05245 [Pseudohalocynthiibacter aestuariivivens]|uniref:Protein NnrT n=1 Tax=Roseovarius pelagicus TaxID=2980108 RepID=A0ABY6DD25_9RHOB|nr:MULTISPECIES: hypothetical protein [Rhodobacterales]QIE44979.1 hypothetical protein G5B38_05245 [Pseudohalocynthiibacter aestuariivivens]UXX83103.1 hypothetical protein N7U68_18815 [Roseovarius pelagicus]